MQSFPQILKELCWCQKFQFSSSLGKNQKLRYVALEACTYKFLLWLRKLPINAINLALHLLFEAFCSFLPSQVAHDSWHKIYQEKQWFVL